MTDTLSLEQADCSYCGSTAADPWGVENGFVAVKCTDCGLVYVTPRPSMGAITEATRLGQHATEAGTLEVAYDRSERKLRRYRSRVKAMYAEELARGQPLDWLDVGAGFGELVEALSSLLPTGSKVSGIEPMQPKVSSARARGLAVDATPIEAVGRQFDVVSMVNILSHLPDPDAFLANIAALVRPGGSLWLVTGNGGDLATRAEYPDKLDLPDHLLFAGVGHIEQFLGRQGVTVEKQDAIRRDTPTWFAKAVVKRALGRSAHIVVPYRSKFRDVSFKARKPLAVELN